MRSRTHVLRHHSDTSSVCASVPVDEPVDLVDRPRRRVVVIPVCHDAGCRAVESADETACGDQGLTGDVLGQATYPIGIRLCGVLGWRGVERTLQAGVVEQSAAMEVGDVLLVVRTAGQPGLGA